MNCIKTKTAYVEEWRNSNGYYHNENGPAVIWSNGTKFWYIEGRRHREDGPAIEWFDGKQNWYLNGVFYGEQEYKHEIIKRNLKKLKV